MCDFCSLYYLYLERTILIFQYDVPVLCVVVYRTITHSKPGTLLLQNMIDTEYVCVYRVLHIHFQFHYNLFKVIKSLSENNNLLVFH